jgi:hypothetical protein
MELYNGGVIHYSLANWVFGGNVSPRDQDSYIGKVVVKRDIDGTVSIYDTINIPVFVSSVRTHNDFRPMPIEEGTDAYYRVRSKLDGTFTGPNLVVDYSHLRRGQPAEQPQYQPPADYTPPADTDETASPPEEED